MISQPQYSRLNLLSRAGKKIVFTNGVFDLCTPGHVHFLQIARSLGDYLVVGVNSDDSVRKLKGYHRPIIPEQERVMILKELRCVDMVIVFNDISPEKLIRQVHPAILVKGWDYADKKIIGTEYVESYGGECAIVERYKDFSTTKLINDLLKVGVTIE